MKFIPYYILCIIFSLFLGCGLSENKARMIINDKLEKKKNVISLRVRGKTAKKTFSYLIKNDYIDHLPAKTTMSGKKQFKITPSNGIVFHSNNSYLSTSKDSNTGELIINIPLHIHEHVKKIIKISYDSTGKKATVKYTGQYMIIKSNDRLWSWCQGIESCSSRLSKYLNKVYTSQITLEKGDKGWN